MKLFWVNLENQCKDFEKSLLPEPTMFYEIVLLSKIFTLKLLIVFKMAFSCH